MGVLSLSRASIAVALWALLAAEAPGAAVRWTRIGGTGVEAGLAGPAGRPIHGTWFSADGRHLYAELQGGRLWVTEDEGATWRPVVSNAIPPLATLAPEIGQDGSRFRVTLPNPYRAGVAYALGEHLYRSDDGGSAWSNLTALESESVIGHWQAALAISPSVPGLIVVGNSMGLWKSYDEGVTWASLNHALPNFPDARFRSVAVSSSLTLESESLGRLELLRNSRGAFWRVAGDPQRTHGGLPPEDRARISHPAPLAPLGYAVSHRVWRDGRALSGDLTGCGTGPACAGVGIVALVANGQLWAGTSNGRIWVSRNNGATWALSWKDPENGPVTSLWAHPDRMETALAVVGGRVLRSTNGGTAWFDISADLPDAGWTSVAGHLEGGTAYIGGTLGVYYSRVSLTEPGPAGGWTEITGALTPGTVQDLAVEPLRGRLYASLPGHGIFWIRLPEVAGALRALRAADLSLGPAAPGSLLTILGTEALRASAGGRPAPILDAQAGRTQLQVPFAVEGRSLRLQLEEASAQHVLEMPLEEVAPTIFVVDSEPLVLDAGTGAHIGWARPARPGGSVLVMASGLGAVTPQWPAGVAAPERNPPRPRARIEATLDGLPVEVVSARLAVGYTGVYVVEVAVPAGTRAGRSRLAITAAGRSSERVELVIGEQRR